MDPEVTNSADPSPDWDYEPLRCQLANGHRVVFMFSRFWLAPTGEDRRDGQGPVLVQAIRVYTNGDYVRQRSRLAFEYRLGKDFELEALEPAWNWLGELMQSRELYDYDDLDELMSDLADRLQDAAVEATNAVDHYDHLPELDMASEHGRWLAAGETESP